MTNTIASTSTLVTTGVSTASTSITLGNPNYVSYVSESNDFSTEPMLWFNGSRNELSVKPNEKCKIIDKSSANVEKVDIIHGNSGENRGVKITFADGDVQKSVCSEHDDFSLETGISICLTKHLLKRDGFENPSAAYNNTIRKAVKIYEKKIAEEKDKEEVAKRIKDRKKKVAEKKRRREERKKNAEREYQIDVQKEAYIRAFRELQNERLDDLK